VIVVTNVITKTMLAKYLQALSEDEAIINEAGGSYEVAKAALDVGLRRYIALRQFVTEQLGKSPYAADVEWPDSGSWVERGRYRFTGLTVGDAILEVLQEQFEQSRNSEYTSRWMTLPEIIDALSTGGLGFPEPVSARSVNAALLRTTGIQRGNDKARDAVYSFEPGSTIGHEKGSREIDLDDAPFEA
jgi:hypothetical protein